MFIELMPLLTDRTVLITVAKVDDKTLRVNVIHHGASCGNQRLPNHHKNFPQKGTHPCAFKAKVDLASTPCHCPKPSGFVDSSGFQTLRRPRSTHVLAMAWRSRLSPTVPRCFATVSSLMPTGPSKPGSGFPTSSREIRWKCNARSSALASCI